MENALLSVSSFCSLVRRDLASATRGHKARGLPKSKKRGAAMIPSNVARTTGQVAAVAILVNAGNTHAQVAGSSPVGVTEEEMRSS